MSQPIPPFSEYGAPDPPPAPQPDREAKKRGPDLNIALFVLTCLSTTFVGGPAYAAGLMAILLTHEMGHYLMARARHVQTSLPYFIPMPFSILGTFGAIIVARSHFPTRREIFDVGVAGPLAGFVVALPAWLVGLSMSTIERRDTLEASAAQGLSIEFGDSLLTMLTSAFFFPEMTEDAIIIAHPLAMAGWVGLILTAINLLPAGSLDGGHISYAFFWKNHRRLSILTAIGMVVLGSQAITLWPANPPHLGPIPLPLAIDSENPRMVWLVWGALVSLFALNHPPPLDPLVPMTRGRRWVALLALCIFFLTFVPDPLRITGPEPGEVSHESEPEHDPVPERGGGSGPDRDPRRGRSLDVRATPELRPPLRHGPA